MKRTRSSKLLVYPRYGIFLERDNRTIAFNPRSIIAIEINQSAKLILEILRKPQKIAQVLQLTHTLAPHFSGRELKKIRNFISHLLEEGLIEEADKASNSVEWKYDLYSSSPQQIYVSPTDKCNLNCVYCYNEKTRARNITNRTYEMKLSEWKNVLLQLKTLGCKQICFTGGEPLLSPILRPLIEYSKALELTVVLITNGTLINKEWAAWIATYVDSVNVSLDSHIAEHNDANRGEGSFNKITTGIRYLVSSGVQQIFVCPTVTKSNIDELPDLIDFCYKDLGCEFGKTTIFTPRNIEEARTSTLMPDFDAYLKASDGLIKRAIKIGAKTPFEAQNLMYACKCGAGSTILSIKSSGNVYPCQLFHKDEMILGNVLETSLTDIYTSSAIINILRSLELDCIAECRECSFITVCGTGCRALAWLLYGNINAFNKLFCPFYKKRAIEKIWNWIDAPGAEGYLTQP